MMNDGEETSRFFIIELHALAKLNQKAELIERTRQFISTLTLRLCPLTYCDVLWGATVYFFLNFVLVRI
jgi:hypothetical protein